MPNGLPPAFRISNDLWKYVQLTKNRINIQKGDRTEAEFLQTVWTDSQDLFREDIMPC